MLPTQQIAPPQLSTVDSLQHESPSSPLGVPQSGVSEFHTQDTVRVLHVVNGEHYSGAERVQDLLAQQLPRFGVQPEIACIKPGKFPTERRCQSTPLHLTPMSSRLDFTAAVKLALLVRKSDFDLLHAHTPRSALLTALASKLTGRPWVFHIHSPTIHDSTRRFINRINHWVERWSIEQAACLIGVSQTMCDHMLSTGVDASRLHRVANGVPVQECLAPNRHQGSDHFTVGTVALFRPRKGTELLLEAVSLLRESGHDIRLRAVGGFETEAYEQLLKNLVTELGIEDAVTWTGYTQQVAKEMESFDAFALPSHFGEGMPMVVLESMALGIPVVSTRVEGVPEVITDGLNGLLADPGDVTSFAGCLQRLSLDSSLATEIGVAGHRRQRAAFSDRSMAEGVARVYDQLLFGDPSRRANSDLRD